MMHFKVCQATKKVIPDQTTAYCAAAGERQQHSAAMLCILVLGGYSVPRQCQKVTKIE